MRSIFFLNTQNLPGVRGFRWLRFIALLVPVSLLPAQPVAHSYNVDTDFPDLSAACKASQARTLLLSKSWTNLPAQVLNCNIYAVEGGILQPAAHSTIRIAGSFEGDLSQHFDVSMRGSIDLRDARMGDLYPQWFGAQCGGADDTSAIQDTLNASSGHRTIRFTCQSTISSSLYLPATAGGTILVGFAYPAPYNNDYAMEDSLIAKKGSPPFAMLHILAPSVSLEHFGVGCNNAAVTGIVWSGAIAGRTDMEQTDRCLGDGEVVTSVLGKFSNEIVTPAPETSTVTTSGFQAGAARGTTFTVRNAVLTGQVLGGVNCLNVMLEYGTPRQEAVAITGEGNTLKLTSQKVNFTHPAGSVIQCDGNNNGLTFNHRQAFFNKGWGRSVYASSDNNNIIDNDFTDFGNQLGGILASGSALGFSQGHSEGNSGPALQLGDIHRGESNGTNGRVVFGSIIDPFLDLENSQLAFNAVHDVCGQFNTIRYKDPKEFVPYGAGDACASYKLGVSDVGFGFVQNPKTGIGQLSVKTKDGYVTLQPNDPKGLGGNVFSGLQFYDQSGQLLNMLQGNSSITGALSTGKTSTSYFAPQWEVNGGPFADGDKLDSGVRTDQHTGFLQVLRGRTPGELQLNPAGGNIVLGTSGSSVALPGYSGKGPLCLDTAGRIYIGDNSGRGVPCPR